MLSSYCEISSHISSVRSSADVKEQKTKQKKKNNKKKKKKLDGGETKDKEKNKCKENILISYKV